MYMAFYFYLTSYFSSLNESLYALIIFVFFIINLKYFHSCPN